MATLTTSYQKLGEITTSTYTKLRIYGKYNSQNTSTLKTNVSLQVRLYGVGSGSFSSGTVKINSSSTSLSSTSYTKGAEKTLKTLSYDITHSSDGTSSSNKATYSISTTGSVSGSGSITFSLPTIPTKSSPTLSNSSPIVGNTITLYTNRKVSSYTHKFTYSIAGLSGTIATGVATSTTWTIPSEFNSAITTSKSSTGTITCETFNSSGSSLGSNSVSITINVDQSACSPTVEITNWEATDTSTTTLCDSGSIIKGISSMSISITSSALDGATVQRVDIVDTNGNIIASDTTTGETTHTTNISIDNVGVYLQAQVTDSRGLTTITTNSIPTSMVEYIKLTSDNSPSISRESRTSAKVQVSKYEGIYYNGSFSTSQANALTIKWRYKKASETDYSDYYTIPQESITFGTETSSNTYNINNYVFNVNDDEELFDYRYTYNIEISVSDRVMTLNSSVITIPLGIANFAVYPKALTLGEKWLFQIDDDGDLLINNDLYTTSNDEKVNVFGDKNIIVCGLSANQTISGTTETKINMNTEIEKIGTKLTLDTSNYQIVIGEGVNHILVSGQAICNTFTTNGLRRLNARKNGTDFARAMKYYTQAFDGTINITPRLIEVEEGDYIEFTMRNAGNTGLYSSDLDTYFIVEVVD